MGIVIAFPAERRSVGTGLVGTRDDSSVIILPVIRIERESDKPTDGCEPGSTSSGRKRRKR